MTADLDGDRPNHRHGPDAGRPTSERSETQYPDFCASVPHWQDLELHSIKLAGATANGVCRSCDSGSKAEKIEPLRFYSPEQIDELFAAVQAQSSRWAAILLLMGKC